MVKNNLQRVGKVRILSILVGTLVGLVIGNVFSQRVFGRPIEFDMILILFSTLFLGAIFLPVEFAERSKKEKINLIAAYGVSMMVVLGLTVLVRHYVYEMPVVSIIFGSISSWLVLVGFFLFFSRKRTA